LLTHAEIFDWTNEGQAVVVILSEAHQSTKSKPTQTRKIAIPTTTLFTNNLRFLFRFIDNNNILNNLTTNDLSKVSCYLINTFILSLMWKPGSEKPENPSMGIASTHSLSSSASPFKDPPAPSSGDPDGELSATKTKHVSSSSSSSTPRKRLSGATLNMKFMKRKKELNQHQSPNQQQQQDTSQQDDDHNNQRSRRPQQQQQESTVDMDIDQDNPTMAPSTRGRQGVCTQQNGEERYGRATSADMYGIEGSIIGRRSFRGFNPAMERSWKDCKASLENRQHDVPREKISDEELLRRYQHIAKARNSGSGGNKYDNAVGNLDSKIKKRKRQGLR
jgi:hypothetical protein